jgi:hypothetical protein
MFSFGLRNICSKITKPNLSTRRTSPTYSIKPSSSQTKHALSQVKKKVPNILRSKMTHWTFRIYLHMPFCLNLHTGIECYDDLSEGKSSSC